MNPNFACLVVGTDTGIGKTYAACALLHALGRRHERVAGMKAVAAGAIETPDGLASEDALALRAASTVRLAPELHNPVLLPEPLSPHLAAQRAGRRIELDALVAACARLRAAAQAVVVEGAGGFLVPLDDSLDGGDLARALGLPLLLVVGMRLGCLNHARLTAEAIRARGLVLAGWIANRIDPHFACPDENVAYLRKHLGAPLLADLAYAMHSDPAAAAGRFDLDRLA